MDFNDNYAEGDYNDLRYTSIQALKDFQKQTMDLISYAIKVLDTEDDPNKCVSTLEQLQQHNTKIDIIKDSVQYLSNSR